MCMGVYGIEVEEEIFENEYKCFFFVKRVGFINREIFFKFMKWFLSIFFF